MRILILHSRYLSGPASGENRVVDDEARLLEEHGHDVTVWSPTIQERSGIGLIRTAAAAVWSRSASATLRELLARHRPDVVHVHNLIPALSPAVLRVVPPEVAIVATLHNYRLTCLPGNLHRDGRICEDCVGRHPLPGVVHACYRGSRAASVVVGTTIEVHRALRTYDRVTLFLAVSDFLRAMHLRLGIEPERIVVKRNFAWPSVAREGPGDHFLYAGRLVPEKGLDTVVRAWSGVEAPLLIVGEGDHEAQLRALAPPNVEFRATVPGDEIAALTRHARAMLVPSEWYETASRTVLEAYAAGVPVLASRIGALPEVVDDGVTGFLVDPGAPAAWARAAGRLLVDDVSTELGGHAAAAWRERFGPDRAIGALEEVYERARGMVARR
jgi:glycosyltransferase involved in cell wall biosynthesis